jgi:hypothetical protein
MEWSEIETPPYTSGESDDEQREYFEKLTKEE